MAQFLSGQPLSFHSADQGCPSGTGGPFRVFHGPAEYRCLLELLISLRPVQARVLRETAGCHGAVYKSDGPQVAATPQLRLCSPLRPCPRRKRSRSGEGGPLLFEIGWAEWRTPGLACLPTPNSGNLQGVGHLVSGTKGPGSPLFVSVRGCKEPVLAMVLGRRSPPQ